MSICVHWLPLTLHENHNRLNHDPPTTTNPYRIRWQNLCGHTWLSILKWIFNLHTEKTTATTFFNILIDNLNIKISI